VETWRNMDRKDAENSGNAKPEYITIIP